MKIKEYAILNGNIDEVDGSEIVFESKDKQAIVDYLKMTDRDVDDDGTTIESYYVDEDDDFLEGSDYDIPTNFIKNIDKR